MLSSSKLAIAALSLAQYVVSLPTHAEPAVVIKRQAELRDEYDFIIAGAGTAGLTLADRLSESGEYTVLVVEYGYLDSSFAITATGPDSQIMDFQSDFYTGTRFYNITSEPLVHVNGQARDVLCGCVVGGSSAVNGMMFDRGSAEDYDAWVWAVGEDHEEEYAKEWGWSNIYPAFKKSVTFHPPTKEMQDEYKMTYDMDAYGGDTPIHSSYAPFQWPTTIAIFDAWKTIDGVKFPVEHADGNATGVFWCPNSIDPSDRTRSYARRGHYDNGANKRKNFHLLPAHRVTNVVLEDTEDEERPFRAAGIHIAPRDGPMFEDGPVLVKAKKEITVSAGTVHTPQVLQRSGIGPKDVLEAAGVEVKVELPGVGWNLQDHAHYSISFNFTKNLTPNPNSLGRDAEFTIAANQQWREDKSGPLSANVNLGAFLPTAFLSNRSDEIIDAFLAQDPAEFLHEGAHPTLVAGYAQQMKTMGRMFKSRDSAELEWLFSGRDSFAIILIKITSRGIVHLSPDDDGDSQGHVEPVVDWRTFSNPIDAELTTEFLRFARWFMKTPAMVDSFAPEEISPGVDVEEDEDIKDWIKGRISPSNGHFVGTASLGPKKLGGVVGPTLLVHGVQGLSVADNSIMTIIPGTHTSSTAYAIGERAAEIIMKRATASASKKPKKEEEEDEEEKEEVETEEPEKEEPEVEEPDIDDPEVDEPVVEDPVVEDPMPELPEGRDD